MFSNLDIPIVAGFVAFIYVVVLTEPQMFLAPWYKFLERELFKSRPKLGWYPNERSDMPQPVWIFPGQHKIAEAIFKLAIECDRCIAGQIALWWYLLRADTRTIEYWPMEHLFLICIAIFVPIIMQKIYRECRK